MQVSLVVLAWDQLSLTQACVASLRATTDVPHEVVIVDNGSAPEAAAWAEANADVAVLHDDNLGFARGMNAGLEVAGSDVVAFVNNDTVWPAGWTGPLLKHFDDPDARTGIVAPAVTAAGNPVTVREEPTDEVIVFDPFSQLPSGVAYLMRTETARALGGFTERYRLAMSEDLDLLFTCWVNDLDVILDTRVLVEHELHASLDQLDEDRAGLWRENLDDFLARWTRVTASDLNVLPDTDPAVVERNVRHARSAATWLARQDMIRSEHESHVQDVRQQWQERVDTLRDQVDEARAAARPGVTQRLVRRIRSYWG